MVRLAVKIRDETRDGQTGTFTVRQLHSIMAASNLVALAEFWRALQCLAEPNAEISLHAESVLRELAEFSFRNCGGVALSPENEAVFRHFGLTPIRRAPPGEYASC